MMYRVRDRCRVCSSVVEGCLSHEWIDDLAVHGRAVIGSSRSVSLQGQCGGRMLFDGDFICPDWDGPGDTSEGACECGIMVYAFHEDGTVMALRPENTCEDFWEFSLLTWALWWDDEPLRLSEPFMAWLEGRWGHVHGQFVQMGIVFRTEVASRDQDAR